MPTEYVQASPFSHMYTKRQMRWLVGPNDALMVSTPAMKQVLGVNRAASRETCIKASEELLGSVPDVGYSQVMRIASSASRSLQGSIYVSAALPLQTIDFLFDNAHVA